MRWSNLRKLVFGIMIGSAPLLLNMPVQGATSSGLLGASTEQDVPPYCWLSESLDEQTFDQLGRGLGWPNVWNACRGIIRGVTTAAVVVDVVLVPVDLYAYHQCMETATQNNLGCMINAGNSYDLCVDWVQVYCNSPDSGWPQTEDGIRMCLAYRTEACFDEYEWDLEACRLDLFADQLACACEFLDPTGLACP